MAQRETLVSAWRTADGFRMIHTIALAIPELDSGGPDRVIAELLHGLPRKRFRLQLIVQKPGGRLFERLPGDVEIAVIGDARRYPALAYRRAIDRLEPDLVMTTLRMNATAGFAKTLFGHPPILVARQANAIAVNFRELRAKAPIKQRLVQPVITHAMTRADAMIAQSLDMADELRAEVPHGVDVETIGNPVSIADIDADLARQRDGAVLPAGTPSLVAVGRLMPQKGFDLLIDALPTVVAAHPQAMLTIYGDGPDKAALEARAVGNGVRGAIHFAGHSAHVLAQVAAADLYISSSRYEGFSNAILEAMALGAVVVATACPGATREMISDCETGFLVPVEDSAALAHGILRGIAARAEGIGAAARASVAVRYDRVAICTRYADFFSRLIERR